MTEKKRILIFILIAQLTLTWPLACATAPNIPTLKDYQPHNSTEAEIISTLLELFEVSKKNNNAEDLVHFFDEDVVMITDYPSGSFKPGILSDYDYLISHWNVQLRNWKTIKGQSYAPLEFVLDDDNASLVYPYKFWIGGRYWEIGRVHLKFKKINSKWVIKRWVWDLIDTNHPNYNPALWEEQKKNFLPEKWRNNSDHPAHRWAGPG